MPVPWTQIITWAPQIISLSRDLLGRARTPKSTDSLVRATNPSDLAERMAALEENERRQAELVDKMATQMADLSRAVTTLHRRQRWLIGGVVVLSALLVWSLLRG